MKFIILPHCQDTFFPVEEEDAAGEESADPTSADHAGMSSGSGGSKKSGKGKSGDGTKKPINAFLMYCQVKRSKAQEKHLQVNTHGKTNAR